MRARVRASLVLAPFWCASAYECACASEQGDARRAFIIYCVIVFIVNIKIGEERSAWMFGMRACRAKHDRLGGCGKPVVRAIRSESFLYLISLRARVYFNLLMNRSAW